MATDDLIEMNSNDLVALTVGTEHGNEHHHDLLYERTNMAYLTAKVQI